MNMRWLAAVLCPRDVYLHPNFFSEEPVSCTSLLALVVAGRMHDYARATSGLDYDAIHDGADGGFDVLQACEQSQQAGTVKAGAERLETLVLGDRVRDSACAVAASLMASVAFSELDEHARAIDVLQRALERVAESAPIEHRLLTAALTQQLSLREYELGVRDAARAQSVLQLLDGLSGEQFEPFPLSLGVGWESSRTIDSIVALLRSAADSQRISALAFVNDDWKDFIRSEPVELLHRNQVTALDGYRTFVKRAFERSTGSAPKYMFSNETSDGGIGGALLLYELSGHPAVRRWRTDLGAVRYMASLGDHDVWSRQDALRLLRQGGDTKMFAAAARHTRSSGPLEALASDALQVVAGRMDARSLGTNDLKMLESAAPALAPGDASEALDALFAAKDHQVPLPVGPGWRAESVRIEESWLAIIALAHTADKLTGVTEMLLGEVASREDVEESEDRAYALVLRRIPWDNVSDDTVKQWREWSSRSRARYPIVGEVLDISLPFAPVASPARETSHADLTSVEAIARAINRVMVASDLDRIDFTGAPTTLLVQAIRDLRATSQAGTFSFGGAPVLDVSVAVAIYAQVDSLWPHIGSALVDKSLSRSDTGKALDRIAREHARIPDVVVQILAENSESLLSAGDHIFGADVIPFPAALRALVCSGALTADEALVPVARLSASGEAEGRSEAARTLAQVLWSGCSYAWIEPLLMQLSFDPEVGVRAEAGRGLALLAGPPASRARVYGRLTEMLSDGGLLTPLLILRGLQDSEAPVLEGALLEKVRGLAKRHPSPQVQETARLLVSE